MTYAFMTGALVLGAAIGALTWECLIAEPLRRRLHIIHRLHRR